MSRIAKLPPNDPCTRCGGESRADVAWVGGIPLCPPCRKLCVDRMGDLMGSPKGVDEGHMGRGEAQAIVARELQATKRVKKRIKK